MKAYDIIGRVCEGAFYCQDCCDDDSLDPVFAGEGGEFSCCTCSNSFGSEEQEKPSYDYQIWKHKSGSFLAVKLDAEYNQVATCDFYMTEAEALGAFEDLAYIDYPDPPVDPKDFADYPFQP